MRWCSPHWTHVNVSSSDSTEMTFCALQFGQSTERSAKLWVRAPCVRGRLEGLLPDLHEEELAAEVDAGEVEVGTAARARRHRRERLPLRALARVGEDDLDLEVRDLLVAHVLELDPEARPRCVHVVLA